MTNVDERAGMPYECIGKSGYKSRSGARSAVRLLREKGERVHPYLCSVCHRWHVGHGSR